MKKLFILYCVFACIVSFYFGFNYGVSVGVVSSNLALLQMGAAPSFVKEHSIDSHQLKSVVIKHRLNKLAWLF